ncbi:uncharacterized protein LOC143031175 [Oratosquilla oratoria]|uniref:uncharacterized protein LOC143031175 n=1 Tax=Oratosquilla oratoria TaxID=337810 RepID=UPI003F76278D
METNVQEGKMSESSTNTGNLMDRSINIRKNSTMEDTESDAVHSPKSLVRRTADKNLLTCGLCSAAFKCSSSLKAHIHVHTGEKPHRCSHCESSFIRLGDLQRHLRTHTGEKPFKCTICSVAFSESSRLKRHIRSHTNEKPYECTACKAAFSNLGHLKIHIRTHTGEKPYRCTDCEASYSSSTGLKRHIMSHTGERPFECTVCDSSFHRSGHLTDHMRTHTGEKPFKCCHCKASFSWSSSLKIHMRAHTGEKPFQCTACQASFKKSCSLNRHMRTHANGKPRMSSDTVEKPYVTNVRQSSFLKQGSSGYDTRSSGKPFKCDHCTLSFHQSSELKSHVKTHAVLSSFHGLEGIDNFDSHGKKSIGASDVSSHHIGYMSHTCTISYSQKEVKEEPNVTGSSYGLSVSQENMEIKIEEHDLDLEMTASIEQDLFDS